MMMGAMNRGHSFSHIDRKLGIVPAVGPAKESYTVETNDGYILATISGDSCGISGAGKVVTM